MRIIKTPNSISTQAKGLLRDGPEDSNLAWKLQPGMVIRHRIWEDSMRGYPTKDKKPTSKELNISGKSSIYLSIYVHRCILTMMMMIQVQKVWILSQLSLP